MNTVLGALLAVAFGILCAAVILATPFGVA